MGNRTKWAAAGSLILALALGGCAANKTQVQTAPDDSALSCADIEQEIAANNSKIQELEQHKSNRRLKNVAFNAIGLLGAPNRVNLGYQAGTEEQQMREYEARNHVLLSLSRQNRCYAKKTVPAKK